MEQVWLAGCPRGHLTGLADHGMSRAAAHLPLKHWGSVLSFLWKRTILLLQVPMVKTGILPRNILICKDCSQMKSARTDRSGWPWLPEGWLSSAFETLGLCSFLPNEKTLLPGQAAMAKTEIPLPKIPISKDSAQIKGARIEVWLACPMVATPHLLPKHLGFALFFPIKKICQFRPGTRGQNWDSISKTLNIRGLLPNGSCQDRQVWLLLATWVLPLPCF